jgi:hypothetical protein
LLNLIIPIEFDSEWNCVFKPDEGQIGVFRALDDIVKLFLGNGLKKGLIGAVLFSYLCSEDIADDPPFIVCFFWADVGVDLLQFCGIVYLDDGGVGVDEGDGPWCSIGEVEEVGFARCGYVAAYLAKLPVLEFAVEVVPVGEDHQGRTIGDLVPPAAEAHHELAIHHKAHPVHRVLTDQPLILGISKVYASKIGFFWHRMLLINFYL